MTVLDDFLSDARYALRSFARSPGFTAVAVLTLAFGIGANTAVFSVVNAVVLRPLSFPGAERAVRVVEVLPGLPGQAGPSGEAIREPIPAAELMQLPGLTRSIGYADGYGTSVETRFGHDHHSEVRGARVSGATLALLRARTTSGRLFDDSESAASAPVVILSDRVWRTHFGARHDALGETITVEGLTEFGAPRQLYTVIGVMAPDFSFPSEETGFWVPFTVREMAAAGGRPPNLAWLADGATLATAQQEVASALASLRGGTRDSTFHVVGLQEELVAPIRPMLRLLSLAVGLVLVIACANVANLVLARTTVRAREMTLRVALGAGRNRIVRQLLTESTMLALLGGAVAVVLALGGIAMMRVAFAEFGTRPGLLRAGMFRQVGVDPTQTVTLPRVEHIGIDVATLLFTAGICMLTTLLVGLAPAVRVALRDHMAALREGAATAASGLRLSGPHTGRSVLVVVQVALAVTLLVGGGLLTHSLVGLLLAEKGYDTTDVFAFQVRIPRGRVTSASSSQFAQRLVERLQTLPGISSAGYSTSLPGANAGFGVDVRQRPGDQLPGRAGDAVAGGAADLRMISSGFADTMGIRVVAGHGFDAPPPRGRRRVLINETMARLRFPGRNPVGTEVYLSMGGLADPSIRLVPWEITGVVGDVRQSGLDREADPQLFVNLDEWQWSTRDGFVMPHYFVVRTDGSGGAVLGPIRATAQQLDPSALLDNVTSLDAMLALSIARPRTYATVFGTFAVLAALLAALGIYGVMAYAVAQSTREIGVRMAVGARRVEVLGLVLRRAGLLAALGMIIGLAGGVSMSRLLQGMIVGLTPLDPPTLGAVALVFAAIALMAAYVPARRATRVDPLVALRHD